MSCLSGAAGEERKTNGLDKEKTALDASEKERKYKARLEGSLMSLLQMDKR